MQHDINNESLNISKKTYIVFQCRCGRYLYCKEDQRSATCQGCRAKTDIKNLPVKNKEIVSGGVVVAFKIAQQKNTTFLSEKNIHIPSVELNPKGDIKDHLKIHQNSLFDETFNQITQEIIDELRIKGITNLSEIKAPFLCILFESKSKKNKNNIPFSEFEKYFRNYLLSHHFPSKAIKASEI